MKLTRLQLEQFLLYRYDETDRRLPDNFFFSKTDIELKYMMISERNMLQATENHINARQQNSSDPKPPNTTQRSTWETSEPQRLEH